MTTPETPKDGDFASYLEGKRNHAPAAPAENPASGTGFGAPSEPPRQTVQQVLVEGEEPTDEFLEEWNALEAAPPLSDEELVRQALNAPGGDGDISTPE